MIAQHLLALIALCALLAPVQVGAETVLERVLARIGAEPGGLFVNLAENRDPVAGPGQAMVVDGSIILVVHSETPPTAPSAGPPRIETISIGATNAAGLTVRSPAPGGIAALNAAQNAATVLGSVGAIAAPHVAPPATLSARAIGATNTGNVTIAIAAPGPGG